jgi:hypothetical protein
VRSGSNQSRARRIAAAAAVLSVGAAIVVVLLDPATYSGRSSGGVQRAAGTTPSARTTPKNGGTATPPRVAPGAGAQQSTVDSELSRAEQPAPLPPGGIAGLPAAGYSSAYPAIAPSERSDAAAFATAFVTELVDRDYARQSRDQLLVWAQAESAPNTLPGVNPALAGHSLVLSLLDPGLAPGPVPTPEMWTQAAAAGQVQTVTNIESAVNPDWLALTSSGWQPADPNMTVLTVTANLVSSGPGGGRPQSFSLQLTLGSAGSHPGYGAVAVDDWTVM